VIDTDFAELVDNHSRVLISLPAQELPHEGGFTAAQKSGDDG
jgi:hypothetical protein